MSRHNVSVDLTDDPHMLTCKLQIRNLDKKEYRGHPTVNDTCDAIATSFILDDDGRKLPRCEKHRGKKREHLPHIPN